MTWIDHPSSIAAVAAVVMFVGLVLQIVATATVGWLENTKSNVTYGLWVYCNNISVCEPYGTNEKDVLNLSAILACEAFSILSILSASGTIVVYILHVIHEENEDITRRLYKATPFWMDIFPAVCSVICIYVWIFKGPGDNDSIFRYSFKMSLAGVACFGFSCYRFQKYIRHLERGSYQVIP